MSRKPRLDTLLHYGVKRRSGRYPWGSGEDPKQHENKFLKEYEELKAQGLKATEIASRMGMNTTQLRNNIMWARNEEKSYNTQQAKFMKEQGMTNTAIGLKLGVSEGSVRNYLSEADTNDKLKSDGISEALTKGVNNTGYLDVGTGVELQLGVSRNRFNAEVNRLVEQEGYHLHQVYTQRLNDPTKWTTVKVLTKEPDIELVNVNKDKIRPLDSWSEDGAYTLNTLDPPLMVDLKRIQIRYAEDGGADKDGLIEMRSGVSDLDLGASKYAQVRIGAGDNLYLKGMAAYTDEKFPDGVDIIFNTNKFKDTPKEKVLKTMEMDPKLTQDVNEMFGSNVARQKGALNIVNEQGEWNDWSGTMSSQFLSKQPLNLIKDRLDATFNDLKSEFDELNSLTNPIVKKHLMESYIDGLDAKAKQLKAKGLPNTKNHVILPITDINANEIYAPNYKDGDIVALVRHPHGGKFEIPELVVNNRNATGKKVITNSSQDAVGIHPSVAAKLSGADFDGDTVLVIPNNNRQVKTSRSLKELKNWSDEMHVLYKRDYQTISADAKQTQMGIVSNLITDMTIKGASNSEIARAVKHSMVVIDAEKHKLDYLQSARDNGINALRKTYQQHINPETGKKTIGASTIISRSKGKIDISQQDTVRDLVRDRVGANGTVLKKGLTTSEVASRLKISESTVKGYLDGKSFDPAKYSSGRAPEDLYVNYIKGIQSVKNTALKVVSSIPSPAKSKVAAKIYESEVKSLNSKLNTALLNTPKERQAQLLTNKLFYAKVKPGMDPDDIAKLKSRSLATARVTVGSNAKKSRVTITEKEWEAIQARAIAPSKLKQILNHSDMDVVRKLATPRPMKMSTAKASRARALINSGYTYAEVAAALGMSTSAIREAIQ